MGHLYRQPIRKWRTQHGLRAVVETGTWEGEGVSSALDAGYQIVVTVDLVSTRKAREMMERGADGARVSWYTDQTSTRAMRSMLREVDGLAVLWWLDAHLPERYGARRAVARTPLLAEVTAIVGDERDHRGDVFVCDDARLYGRPCDDGPLPEGITPGDPEDLAAVEALLEPTHELLHDPRDTGYLVAQPRKR